MGGQIWVSLVKQEDFKCQKCLQKGHFTYQCTGKRKYVERDSRTRLMNKKLKMDEEKAKLETLAKSVALSQKNKKERAKGKKKKR
ncbi:zinc finger CCHC domain-containing protein 10 [Elysia marginata]|uniref:Zinc finger CCHC domain-containing protein 10 n=1 Tax=Elysia marginata TaxID=1093978 RepID=A0AAV4ESK6_9GAST|nr:zinc finger CCHC domain-containing protein 10 [Elysia marginata]